MGCSFFSGVLVFALLAQLAVSMQFDRTHFPPGFIFGVGSSAYQSEGAAHEHGKGPSIWDTFTQNNSEKIADKTTGDVADDLYHRYNGDIKLMKKIGLESFRFSIAWSRVLPTGKVSGGVNHLGVKFYNNLIDQLLSNGIIPFVTLFHWDVPQALEDEYGGFLSSNIVVKQWCTINEPHMFALYGYDEGILAPGRCSNYVGSCVAGGSATEPYIVAHNLLLSHAAAVHLYKQKYQGYQKGIIGMTICAQWFVPNIRTASAIAAAARALDFTFGWLMEPITKGDYPKSLHEYVGDERLPKFTTPQSKQLAGSCDFLGVNYYTTSYVEDGPYSNYINKSYSKDKHVTMIHNKEAQIYPKGLYHLMIHIKEKYNSPTIYITENGFLENGTLSIKENLNDTERIAFHRSHLLCLLEAIKEGVDVKGYYVWSFLDDFEWNKGYSSRCGMIYVDFKHQLTRYLKLSARWWTYFLIPSNSNF